MFSFDLPRLPECTLDVVTDETTGASTYTATVSITGLEPNRTTNTDERTLGIESLDPPTVSAEGVQETFDLAIAATLASYEASGFEITPVMMVVTAMSIRWSLAECFIQAGIDA